MRAYPTPIALALSLSLAACVGPTAIPTLENTQYNPSLQVDLKSSTKLANGEYYRDVPVGTGAAVAAGQTLGVHYTGWLTDGTKFDSNVGAAVYSFVLGGGQVIPGWDQGFAEAHVGGTRQLIIPPGLAYGSSGYLSIPPNAVLVFSVQIDSAQ